MGKEQVVEFQEGLLYSDDVQNAVRYGYQYRKEAEEHESGSAHACLSNAPEILLWLGQKVVEGLAWDLFKELAKKIYRHFSLSDRPLLKGWDSLLTEERELQKFYSYVKEFNEQRMSVTEQQFKYIREEIIADYYGKECGKIYKEKKRIPTIEEYMRINREAISYADKIMEVCY